MQLTSEPVSSTRYWAEGNQGCKEAGRSAKDQLKHRLVLCNYCFAFTIFTITENLRELFHCHFDCWSCHTGPYMAIPGTAQKTWTMCIQHFRANQFCSVFSLHLSIVPSSLCPTSRTSENGTRSAKKYEPVTQCHTLFCFLLISDVRWISNSHISAVLI